MLKLLRQRLRRALVLCALALILGDEIVSWSFTTRHFPSHPGENNKQAAENYCSVDVTFVWCETRAVLDWVGDDDHLTAIATVFIAAFTATLWWSTRRQAQLTRDAIKLAREEFVSTHRPKITVRDFRWEFDNPGSVANNSYRAQFIYLNAGDFTARIEEVGTQIIWSMLHTPGGEPRLPQVPNFNRQQMTLMMEAGEERVGHTATRFSFDGSPYAAVKDGAADIYCVGHIIYSDDRNVVRKTGFCRRYNSTTLRWERFPDGEY